MGNGRDGEWKRGVVYRWEEKWRKEMKFEKKKLKPSERAWGR